MGLPYRPAARAVAHGGGLATLARLVHASVAPQLRHWTRQATQAGLLLTQPPPTTPPRDTVTRFVTSLPMDNCPQPKETLPAVSISTLPY
jgi:hypothetical protein